jgi:RNA-binding protein NOB1
MAVHQAGPALESFGPKGKKGVEGRKQKKRGGVEVSDFEDEPVAEKADAAAPDEDSGCESEGEGEWITPDNLHKLQPASGGRAWTGQTGTGKGTAKGATPATPAAVRVACVSGDFAVQNVLLQMRLRLYSPDGRRVKRLKHWLLRCHACYATTKAMERRFCPKCGGPTLLRTSYSVDGSGRVTLHLRGDYQYRLRGTQSSLPLPRAGRSNQSGGEALLLREDQKEFVRAQRSYERGQRKAARGVTLDAIDDRLSAIFGGLSVGSGAAAGHGANEGHFKCAAPPTIGFGRWNPNEVRRTRK